jgi:hypothetical protein
MTKITNYYHQHILLTLTNSFYTPPQARVYTSYKPSFEQINSNRFQHKNFVNMLTNWSLDCTNGADIPPLSILSQIK